MKTNPRTRTHREAVGRPPKVTKIGDDQYLIECLTSNRVVIKGKRAHVVFYGDMTMSKEKPNG